MAELTVPQINFAPLGELGEIYKKSRDERGLKDAFSQGIGSDPQSLAALAQRVSQYNPQMAVSLAQLAHGYGREGVTDANTKFTQDLEKQRLDIAKQDAERRNQGEAAKVAERDAVLAAKGINPNSAEGRAYSIGGTYSDPESAKPIQVDTLGGTKFMVRKPGGGYTLVDPNNLPPEGIGAPTAAVPSSNRVVGTAEGIASGLYPAPPQASPGPPQAAMPQTGVPLPVPRPAPAQASNFADRFQGQPAEAPAQAPSLQAAPPPDPMAIDPKTGRREGFLATVGGQQIQDYIKKIADYEIDPRTTSIKGGSRERLMSAVAHYDPTYNQNDFGSRAKAIKDFSTGKQGDIVRSFDVAIDHLDTLKTAAEALKNGDSRLLNTIRNRWREQTGSELPTNFKALVPIVSGEIAKAVVGSQNALADREELRAGLQAAASPEQLGGVITGYKALMAGQLKGLRKQYEDTTGKKNFDSRVRESTKKAILNDENGGKEKGPVVIDGYTITEH